MTSVESLHGHPSRLSKLNKSKASRQRSTRSARFTEIFAFISMYADIGDSIKEASAVTIRLSLKNVGSTAFARYSMLDLFRRTICSSAYLIAEA